MKTFVVIPTYNEKENIRDLIDETLALNMIDRIVIVDDDSPDGTQKIIKEISQKNDKVHLIVRHKRYGRGSAGIDGFKYALKNGADYIIEMDADFSHHPKHIPDMLKKITDNNVVLGSRFVDGGKDIGRGIYRHFVSILAGIYVRFVLKIKIKDVSSGFRCFTRKVLEEIDLDNMVSTGPSIVLEILYKVCLKGFKVCEIPIVFKERRLGSSKLDYIVLLETLIMVLRLKKMFHQKRLWTMEIK